MSQISPTYAFPPMALPRRRLWVVALVVAGIAAGGYFWMKRSTNDLSSIAITGAFYQVVPTDLDVKIIKDGELMAINNVDVVNHVEGLNTITYVVPEGSVVKTGDVLVTLDSSSIKHKVDDLKVNLDTSQANLITAQQFEQIQMSQNEANLAASAVALDLAKLDLEAYEKGTFPQSKEDAETMLKMAEQSFTNKQDDLNNTLSLFGKGFVTPSDVKKAELEVTTAANAVNKARTAKMVLMDYQHKKNLTTFESAVAQANKKLEQTRAENVASLTQKQAVTRATSTLVRNLQTQFEEHKEQLENCTIKSPSAGFVIYSSSLDRNAISPIQEGATVRDKQLLIRLPDTTGMKAVVRIPEAQRTRIRIDEKNPMRAIVWITRGAKPIQIPAIVSRISPIADMSQRFYNPDLKEYPVDLTLDYVSGDLKPSESIRSEIFCEHLPNVLAIPLDCVYSVGDENYVFARIGDDVKPSKIGIGRSTETHVEVKTGVSKDDEILHLQAGQGRQLLERNGIKIAPTTRPSNRKSTGKTGGKPGAKASATDIKKPEKPV